MNHTLRKSNIRLIRIPEGVERESGLQEVFNEIVQQNLPNSGNISASQMQEGQKTPNRSDPKRLSPSHLIISIPLTEYNKGILKQVRRKHKVTFRRKPIRITADFSGKTLQVRRE